MHPLASLSLKQKLILIGAISGSVTLVLACIAFTVYDQWTLRQAIPFSTLGPIFLLLLGGVSVVAFLLATQFHRVIAQPVLHLISLIKAAVEQKDYSGRAVKHGEDELGTLSETVNTILTQFQERDAELVLAKENGEAARQAKSQFLARINQDIHTPINGILGTTDLLLKSSLSEQQRHLAETIRQSGSALLNIINDLLDFSQIESGKLTLQRIDFNLRELIEETAEMVAAQAQSKGLEFAYRIDQNVPLALIGDPHRLRQIALNMLGNACKFTEQGEVVLEVSQSPLHPSESPSPSPSPVLPAGHSASAGTPCTLRFVIRDTGVGIAPEAQTALFDSFSHANSPTTQKNGSPGLGLAISRQLAEMMGGTMGVNSQLGSGSTFWWTAQFAIQPSAARPPWPELKPLQSASVLVVDNNATTREILLQQLSSWGIRAAEAESGPQALLTLYTAKSQQQPYDLVLLDRHMPTMDGLSLAKAITSDPILATTRLVMLTSFGQQADVNAAQSVGITTCLAKPIRQAELYTCLATLLEALPRKAPAVPMAASTARSDDDAVAPQATSPRVLLVEDNEINQEVAAQMLDMLGCQVTLVQSGHEAIQALAQSSYDIVFMDCQMPELDGFATTAEIRRREGSTRHTIIVALTANAMEKDRQRCLAAGMDDHLGKPYTQEQLRTMLQRWGSTPTPNTAG